MSPWRRNHDASTGTAVSATSVEATSETHTVWAKGRKNWPTTPGRNPSGMNTATVVSVDATMAGLTSWVASITATARGLPFWMCR